MKNCSPNKQEDKGREEVDIKPVPLTEEHMSCVTGIDQSYILEFWPTDDVQIRINKIVMRQKKNLNCLFITIFSNNRRVFLSL